MVSSYGAARRKGSPNPHSGWLPRPDRDEVRCRAQLQAMLMMMSRPASERGGTGERAFLAFKLHRFISGAGHVYATLRDLARRRVTLDGQRFDTLNPDARLYAAFFCRNCGQEHHPVVLVQDGGVTRILPRPIDETPLDDPTVGSKRASDARASGRPEYAFTGAIEDYPEDWLEVAPRGASDSGATGAVPCAREITVDPAEQSGQPEFERGSCLANLASARVQGSTAKPGTQDQQAREFVGGGVEFRDDLAGVERAAMDEWSSQLGSA